MRTRRLSWAAWTALCVVALGLGLAGVLRPLATPPTLAERVMALAAEFRCPECAGESAAESDAPASLAIRATIARDLEAGMSPAAIRRQLAAEYGTWILYRPPLSGGFVLLWAAPALAVGLATWGVARALRAGRTARAAAGQPAPVAGLSAPVAGPPAPVAAAADGASGPAGLATAAPAPPGALEERLRRFL